MDWTFLLVILVLVLVARLWASARRRAAKQMMRRSPGFDPTPLQARRQAGPGAPVDTRVAPARNAQVFNPGDSATYLPGDSATYQPGDSATYRPGDSATYRPGDSATYAPQNAPTYRPGDSATYRPGDSTTYSPQNAPMWGPGDSPTYQPVAPVGSRPRPGPPQPVPPATPLTPAAPGNRASTSSPGRGRRRTTPNQPAARGGEPIALVVEESSTRRTRGWSDPTRAESGGSTAIGSSALSSTLFTPYQRSSLMTSLRSTLTTTLGDAGGTDDALGAVPSSGSVLAQFEAVPLSPAVEAQVAALLSQGYDVEAVRVVTATTNSGLLEAMATVERMRGIR